MKKVTIDPGHAPGNVNKGPTGYYEYDGMWKLSNYLKKALNRCGINANLTRSENEDPSLAERGKRAKGSDIFISEHSNAANTRARGVECFYSLRIPSDKVWAGKLSAAVSALMGNNDRGAKTRESTRKKGYDYYGVIRSAVAAGVPHVFLHESGFHDNPVDEAFLKVDSNLEEIAEIQAKVLCELLKVKYIERNVTENLTTILGQATATREQARVWLQQVAPDWVLMADLYWSIAPKYNIRPDVALCQACKETGFFNFGGLVQPWQNNFAGIGATGQASDGKTPLRGADPEKVRFEKDIHGAIFTDRATGVEAQIQHLFAYATKNPLPARTTLYSPRFNLVQRGTARFVEHLGAGENPVGIGWAYPGKDYGKSIIRDYMMKLLAVEVDNKIMKELQELKEENRVLLVRIKLLEEALLSINEFTKNKVKEVK